MYLHGFKINKMIGSEINFLLPDRYLEKVDKITIYHSIESRVPMLDNDLVNYLLSLPSKFKVKHGTKKRILKDVIKQFIPSKILKAKKRGFDVPFKHWLKNDLYEFAFDKFNSCDESIFNKKKLLKALQEHRNENRDNGMILWKILVLIKGIDIYKNKIKWN